MKGRPETAAGTWVEQFCERLEVNWRGEKPSRNRLESMIFVLNKRDKVTESVCEKREVALRKIIDKSVNTSEGPNLIDGVVTQLAKTLAGET